MRGTSLQALFAVTAVVEIAVGLALLGLPTVVLAVLLGIHQPATETLFVGWIAGAALLAMGVASLVTRTDAQLPQQRGLLAGILVYDGLVALLLAYAGLVMKIGGPALWPVVVLHTLLALWCLSCAVVSRSKHHP